MGLLLQLVVAFLCNNLFSWWNQDGVLHLVKNLGNRLQMLVQFPASIGSVETFSANDAAVIREIANK